MPDDASDKKGVEEAETRRAERARYHPTPQGVKRKPLVTKEGEAISLLGMVAVVVLLSLAGVLVLGACWTWLRETNRLATVLWALGICAAAGGVFGLCGLAIGGWRRAVPVAIPAEVTLGLGLLLWTKHNLFDTRLAYVPLVLLGLVVGCLLFAAGLAYMTTRGQSK